MVEFAALIPPYDATMLLVLGAAPKSEQAGRVISHVIKRVGKLPIPVTIVPGGLSDEQIDAIS
jgi:hypothetical protein